MRTSLMRVSVLGSQLSVGDLSGGLRIGGAIVSAGAAAELKLRGYGRVLYAGDADAGLGFVGAVDAHEKDGDAFDELRVGERAAFDAANAFDGLRRAP